MSMEEYGLLINYAKCPYMSKFKAAHSNCFSAPSHYCASDSALIAAFFHIGHSGKRTIIRYLINIFILLLSRNRNCKCPYGGSTQHCRDLYCCGANEFQCSSPGNPSKCISQTKKCNSNNDCGNWKDEDGCKFNGQPKFSRTYDLSYNLSMMSI